MTLVSTQFSINRADNKGIIPRQLSSRPGFFTRVSSIFTTVSGQVRQALNGPITTSPITPPAAPAIISIELGSVPPVHVTRAETLAEASIEDRVAPIDRTLAIKRATQEEKGNLDVAARKLAEATQQLSSLMREVEVYRELVQQAQADCIAVRMEMNARDPDTEIPESLRQKFVNTNATYKQWNAQWTSLKSKKNGCEKALKEHAVANAEATLQ